MLDLTGETRETLTGTWNRLYRRQRRTRRRIRTTPSRFYRLLARFNGICDMCGTAFRLSEPIYWCPKTPTTRVCRCHDTCYQKHMGTWGPSRQPSPSEAELKTLREKEVG